jgi:predicted ABC-type ATPase
MTTPILTILAGPNGAGKSTFAAREFGYTIKDGTFLNADEMAKELGNGQYVGQENNAARLIIKKRSQFIRQRQSFIIETTLASRGLLQALNQAQAKSYQIHLHYLWISEPDLCDFRVKQRVLNGGHNIELDIIMRRYVKSLYYLPDYLEKADTIWIYQADLMPVLIMTKEENTSTIHSQELWQQLQTQITQIRAAYL